MQSRRRRGNGPGQLRVNGLIAPPVFEPLAGVGAMDVRRQRNFSQCFQRVADVWRSREMQSALAVLISINNRRVYGAGITSRVANDQGRSDARAFGRTHQSPPFVHASFFEQEYFEFPSALRVDAVQSGGDDARVVQDKHIASGHVVEQVTEIPVRDLSSVATQNEQARFVASRRRRLRHQFRRQMKIKIGGSHLGAKARRAQFKTSWQTRAKSISPERRSVERRRHLLSRKTQ